MKRILITRPRAQSNGFADQLRRAGFEPIYFPVIEIKPIENNVALERAVSKLGCYEWMVFTSVNAVESVFNQCPTLRVGKETKVAAIGPKTAKALRDRNVVIDYIPEEFVAEAILTGMGDLLGKWVLLPRAEIARQELPEAIFNAGGVPHQITVYQTLPSQLDLEGLAALSSGVHVITFTSASTVDNFVAIMRKNNLDPLNLTNHPRVACIGPITEQAARQAGFQNIVVAKEYTTNGLMEVVKNTEVV